MQAQNQEEKVTKNESENQGSTQEMDIMNKAAVDILKIKDDKISELSSKLASTSADLALAKNEVVDLRAEIKKREIIQEVNAAALARHNNPTSLKDEINILKEYNLNRIKNSN